jgi:hypothetical protein
MYVLVITSRKDVGAFLGFPVFRVMSMKFLCCNESLRFSTSQEVRFYSFFWVFRKRTCCYITGYPKA